MRMTFASLLKYTPALLLLVAPVLFFGQVRALELNNRRVVIGLPVASATTTYDVNFDIASASNVGSISFAYCANSPLDGDPCIAPSGFDTSAASLDSQSGETGFAIHANTNANRLVLTRTPAAVTPGPVQYVFSNVINPDSEGSYYLRVHTYASDDGTGALTDRGGFAFTINREVSVAAYVPPILIFCVGVTIPGTDCSSANGNNIDFGVLSEDSTSSGTTQMMVGTNGVGGYSVTVDGTTMTSGNNVITAMSSTAPSAIGTRQFGMNLRNNSVPDVGADVSGIGSGLPAAQYSVVNQYRFNKGDTIAYSPISTELNKFTMSYIVNIDADQPAGYYSTTLTYIAFATF